MPRKQSPLRRCLAMLSVALLAAAGAAGISIPASAAPTRGFLDITSVVNQDPSLSELGGLVKDRPFDVAVRVLDDAGTPTTVNQATTVVLEVVSGPDAQEVTTPAVIPRNGSGVTFSGATYSDFGNDVKLRVRATSGVNLASGDVTVDVAVTAVGEDAAPNGAKTVTDPNCTAPTAKVPNCGQLLLPNGAKGRVTLSVGSCDGLGPCRSTADTDALVVTAIANFKDAEGKPLYTRTSPATVVLACDKDLCREVSNGVPKLPVLYTFDNTGAFDKDKVALECPAKGVVGADQDVCVDYVSSRRKQGDLYLYVLFVHDIRISI
jgi:hypothetical protein